MEVDKKQQEFNDNMDAILIFLGIVMAIVSITLMPIPIWSQILAIGVILFVLGIYEKK